MSKKCPSSITIYGLFPDQDVIEEPRDCGWRIYPRPECVVIPPRNPPALMLGNNQALAFPLGTIIDTSQEFSIEVDVFPSAQSSAVNLPIFENASAGATEQFRTNHIWRGPVANNVLNSVKLGSTTKTINDTYVSKTLLHLNWTTIKFTFNTTAGTWSYSVTNIGTEESHSASNLLFTTGQVQAWDVPDKFYLGGEGRSWISGAHVVANLKVKQGGDTLGYWKLDEGTGEVFYDSSGNNYHVAAESMGNPGFEASWVWAAPWRESNVCMEANGLQLRLQWNTIAELAGFEDTWNIRIRGDFNRNGFHHMCHSEGTTGADAHHLVADLDRNASTNPVSYIEYGTASGNTTGSINVPSIDKDYLWYLFPASNEIRQKFGGIGHGDSAEIAVTVGAGPIGSWTFAVPLILFDDGVNPFEGRFWALELWDTSSVNPWPMAIWHIEGPYGVGDEIEGKPLIEEITVPPLEVLAVGSTTYTTIV